MKSKKFHKFATGLSCLLLILIMFIIIRYVFQINSNKKSNTASYNIALITYNSLDSSYTQILKSSIKNASEHLDKTYHIFDVSKYNNSYEETMQAALSCNVSLIICPDSSFEEVVYKYQSTYKSTYFLLLDGIPHNADNSDSTINYNVIPLTYDEAEAGFLAGYAATYDGYKNITFICDGENSKSLHYCYGFLYGADYAADKCGTNDVTVSISYISADTNAAYLVPTGTDLVATSVKSTLSDIKKDKSISGIPIIMCGGYDTRPDNVIAAATNNIASNLYDVIRDFFSENLKGGSVVKFNTANNGISFVYDETSFTNFDNSDYTELLALIADQKITIISDTTVTTDELELDHITINDSKATGTMN